MPPGGWDRPVMAPLPLTAPYAGWWSRVAAQLVDVLVIGIPAVVLGVVLFGGIGAAFGAGDEFGVGALIVGVIAYLGLFLAAFILYAPLLMRRPGAQNGQTLGKQMLGIRVVKTNGVPMDFTSSAIREVLVKGIALGMASSIIPLLPYILDGLWPLWDDENRAIHDFIVDTRVVEAA